MTKLNRCTEDELVGEGHGETSDRAGEMSRGAMKGERKGRAVGSRWKERTWQQIGFVSRTEESTEDKAKSQA